MADIRYNWAKGEDSVGMNEKLQLPQFRIKGKKVYETTETLSTGMLED